MPGELRLATSRAFRLLGWTQKNVVYASSSDDDDDDDDSCDDANSFSSSASSSSPPPPKNSFNLSIFNSFSSVNHARRMASKPSGVAGAIARRIAYGKAAS